MRRALAGCVLSMALAGSVLAGSFSQGLERYVAGRSSSENITVLVSLKEQAKIAELDAQLREGRATLAQRHEQVITALMNTATRTQGPLLQELSALKGQGKVAGFTPYWITNAVVVNAPIAVLRQLAARADVETVEVDLKVESVSPLLPVKGMDVVPGSGQRVITSGLAAINADDVWNLLGVNGSGALVGGIDTGVDGTHSALSSRWRGNNGHPVSECWLDAAGLGHSTPQDGNGHGTHTMGTMVGGAPGDDIGVAPGAQWIASNIINSGTGAAFDNGVIASFQFMADPDGNPATIDDVPDVVQNSWGVNENFSGYVDCDSRWWAAIDNCEASGVCVTFSAGNEGSGAGTLRSPGDRCITPYSCFAVGATDPANANDMAYFSSRGPSTCSPAAYPIKPEVSAPGVDTYSAYPGGGYTTMSGTSMAGPHVAGVVALMRSANPNVDVNTIKQILMDTAVDMGSAGEDNNYGWGLIDAYQAVMAVMDGYGTVAGTVTAAAGGAPIVGAVVSNTAGPQASTTNGSGAYSMMMAEGSYTLSYQAFGYVGTTRTVNIVADNTVTQNVSLASAPSAILSGMVYGPDGNPVAGAILDFTNAPIADVVSGAGGAYSVSLPLGYTYAITASATGVGSQSQSIAFNSAMSVDFNLPINPAFLPSGPDGYGYRIFDSNDDGGMPYVWNDISGTGTALTLSDDSYTTISVPFSFNYYGTSFNQLSVGSNGFVICGPTGSSSLGNGQLPNGLNGAVVGMWDDLNPAAGGTVYWQNRTDLGQFIVQYNAVNYYSGGGTVSFQLVLLNPASYPSTTGDAQWLIVYNNGDRGSTTTGITSPAGTPFLQYCNEGAYDINASPLSSPICLLVSTNENGMGPVQYPDMAYSPASLSKTLLLGTTGSDDITLTNTGEATLGWTADVATVGLASDVPVLELAKGQADPRVGSASRMGGGPDAFGYSWKDSNEPGGPVYDWVDISGVGIEVGTGDDVNYGPFALGFSFDFYGNSYNSVQVCTNGWLSFTSNYTTYSNQGIPVAGEPENLLAPFWDDLLPSAAGSIKYYADNANQRFIVSYINVPRYSNSSALETFQVILNADGSIVFQYQTVSDVASVTVGIENATGSDGLQVVFNAEYLTNNLAIAFDAVQPWLDLAADSGSVPVGGQGTVQVLYNATELAEGVYSGQVLLTCNDPDTPSVVVPVTLTVIPFALTPVDLGISYQGSGASLLSWQAVPGATVYDVWQAERLDEPFALLGSTTATSYTVTGAAGDAKLFRVVARSN